ncbi:Ubiquitin C-terminal hydrolase 12 [Linum perenne]
MNIRNFQLLKTLRFIHPISHRPSIRSTLSRLLRRLLNAAAKKNSPAMKIDLKKSTWRIDDFSKQKPLFCTQRFILGSYNWMIFVYPRGNEVDHLSVYLQFSEFDRSVNVPAYFSFTLVNQLGGASVKKSNPLSLLLRSQHTFIKYQDNWGFTSFVPISDLSRKGFLVNDTIILETEICTGARASEAAASELKVTDVGESRLPIEEPLSCLKPLLREIQVDSPAKTSGSTGSSFSPSAVQLTSRNLIAELSTMTRSSLNSSSSSVDTTCSSPDHNSGLMENHREKLVGFFDTSLEALCQTKSLNEVKNTAVEVLELVTDPLEKKTMRGLISRLDKFKEVIPSSLSTIESSHAIESSAAQMSEDLEARLVHRKGQLTSLEAEVSRLGEEGSKLDAEIQQLTARKARILEHMSFTEAELKKANQVASKELDELKDQHTKQKQAGRKRKRAEEELAQSNASWKLFKEQLGW